MRNHRAHDQADERPPHGADALDEVAVQHADPARALVAPRSHRRELLRLRHDADETVDGQHDDHPRSDPRGRREREAERLQRCLHSIEPADHAPAERNEHEREDDDEHALKEIGPGGGDQSAHEAVEHEHHRHGDDDLVDADGTAGRLADHLAGAFQHAAGVDDEEAERKHDVDRAHPRPVAVFGELRHRRPADPAEDRRHDPVEGRDEQVFPLEPDGGGAGAVDRPGQRHGHLRVRADAKALGDHQPRTESPPTEKVLAAVAHAKADDEADRRDDDEIPNEDGPVERGDVHPHSMTRRTCNAAVSGSQSAVTVPPVASPR